MRETHPPTSYMVTPMHGMSRGYILGGLLWFAVPFTLATTLGLSALALDLPLSAKEVAEGLVVPAAAHFFFGKGEPCACFT